MYLRNFFLEFKTHSSNGYISIDESLYKKLDNLHRRAKISNMLKYTISDFVSGSLTLISKKDEEKYLHNKTLNYIIIYGPTSFRDTSIDPNTYVMFCGARKKGLKAVKIPLEIQFVLYLLLQSGARRNGMVQRK